MPAVLVGHAVVAGVLLAVALVLLAAGRRGDDAVHPGWSALWAVGALAVLVVAVRWFGVREPTHRGYVGASTGAWVVVPLTWSAAFFGAFLPWGYPEVLLSLVLFFSPVVLALALTGAAVSWAVVLRR